MIERRLSLTVRIRVAWDGGEVSGYSTDVSEQGIFVETNRQLPAGTPVRVEFGVTRRGDITRIVAEGHVVCGYLTGMEAGCSPIAGLGIRFDEFVFGRNELAGYVTEQLRAVHSASAALEAERRVAPRVTVGFPVFWGTASPPDREAFLSNLSATGCLVIGDAEPVGSRLHLWFEYPSSGTSLPTRVEAEVVRLLPRRDDLPPAMGLQFEAGSLEPEQLEPLERFVDTRLAWLRLLEDLPAGQGGWPDFARGEELPPLPSPPPPRIPDAQALEAMGLRPKVVYRMLTGALSALVMLLIVGVLIYLDLTCSAAP